MALRRHFQIVVAKVARVWRAHPSLQNGGIAVATVTLSAIGVAAIIADMTSVASPRLHLASDVLALRGAATAEGAMLQTSDDEWLNKVTSKAFWNNLRKSNGGSSARSRERAEPPARLGAPPSNGLVKVLAGKTDDDGDGPRNSIVGDDDNDGATRGRKRPAGGGDTFRTVCVRLCDGFYTPLSFSTTKDNLERDAERCESSCGGQAKMFYYRNPGSEIEDMEDMDGKPYKKLATAFRFRASYTAQCTCRPQPWSQEALERHKLYALQEAVSKGDKSAKKEAEDLSKRMKKAEADAVAERAASLKALKKAEADAAAERKALEKAAKQAKANGKAVAKTAAVTAPLALELVGAAMSVPAADANQNAMSAGKGMSSRKSASSGRNERQHMSVSPARTLKLGLLPKAPLPSQTIEAAAPAKIRAAADLRSDNAIRSN